MPTKEQEIERLKRWVAADPERARLSQRARSMRWRNKNLVKARAGTRAWYKKNRQHALDYNKRRADIIREQRLVRYKKKAKELRDALYRSRANNPERFQASMQRYRTSELGRATRRMLENKRRATKQKSVCTLTGSEWIKILARYNQSCAYCNRTDRKLTQDHVIPISKGGHHTKENVVPACLSCNSRKWNKIIQ
jgi:5-methylcytosine-specific restriction endonuclease McrA